ESPMGNEEPRDGLVLLCDLNGAIEKVIEDELGITRGLGSGRAFVNLICSESLKQAFSFIEAMQDSRPAIGWGLYFAQDDQKLLLNLNGYSVAGRLIITGARSRVVATQLYHRMLYAHHAEIDDVQARLAAERSAHAARENELLEQLNELRRDTSALKALLAEGYA